MATIRLFTIAVGTIKGKRHKILYEITFRHETKKFREKNLKIDDAYMVNISGGSKSFGIEIRSCSRKGCFVRGLYYNKTYGQKED
ncbi:MAG: hypothetical protein A3H06_02170 [Candidatus Colwellbacteria bacterium RIFCSPLOWO2_12_FULL_44_13]|uniref:Uncharacterized protein n=1 Tax=Candidatus Colwellbacteria bacterium RIFCSPLOWO2_12_FULL_44_13 TaxID=1797694 RepID=A0A1G1Z9B6_9BACT|nr:MAG: hypothetical protein A3H06_02170 [Candidatus Colwellbacteria bacterium RIFCSPLOWO2_12_FULL_44_13]